MGASVLIVGDVPAIVHGFLQRLNGETSYELIWWDGRTRKCEWVTENEFEFLGPPRTA